MLAGVRSMIPILAQVLDASDASTAHHGDTDSATPAQVKAAVSLVVGMRAARMHESSLPTSVQAMVLVEQAHEWFADIGVSPSQLDGATIDGAAFACVGEDDYDTTVTATARISTSTTSVRPSTTNCRTRRPSIS